MWQKVVTGLSEKTFTVTPEDINKAWTLCRHTTGHSWYNPIALATEREFGDGTLCTVNSRFIHIYRRNPELSLRINITQDGVVPGALHAWFYGQLKPFQFTITLYGGKSF